MKYTSLYSKSKSQDKRTVFAHFRYNGIAGETWEHPFIQLSKLAKDEDWLFHREDIGAKYANQEVPILTNYLNYTFLRLQEEEKIKISPDGDKACFNTELMTDKGKDIYASFFRNKQAEERTQPDWTLYSFMDSYSEKLKSFSSPLPEIANYTEDERALFFNTNYEIELNIDHIFKA